MSKNQQKDLTEVVNVSARYVRSINIDRDLSDPNALRGYILTERIDRVLQQLLNGLQGTSTQRAWRLTGPYGGGKSALGLMLATLFEQGFSRRHLAGKLLHDYSVQTHALGAKLPRYRPLIVQGHYADASITIAHCLIKALQQGRSGKAKVALSKQLNRFVKKRKLQQCAADEVIDLLQGFVTIDQKSASEYDGTLLIVDELGRFLDFAAGNDSGMDAGFFQSLAEACAGQQSAPLAIVGILHQRFEDYARAARGDSQLLEWAKVAERFEEVTLEESIDGSCLLLANAIKVDDSSLPKKVKDAVRRRNKTAVQSGILASQLVKGSTATLFPMHPTAAIALTVLARRMGQNERSVYSFLLSQDAGGFQRFIAESALTDDVAYRLHHLCDYLLGQGGARTADEERNKRWSLLQDCLRAAPFHDELELNVLKTVGVLNLLEPVPNVEATRESVSFALTDKTTSKAVFGAIERLTKKNVLFRRPATSELCIWPRSSVDLAGEFQRLKPRFSASRRLDSVLSELPRARPIVAHKHYIETGTLRCLSVHIAPDLQSVRDKVLDDTNFDGALWVLPVYPDESRASVDRALEKASKRVPDSVVIAAQPIEMLALDLARDLEIWRAIAQECVALRVDEYARRELDEVISATSSKLLHHLTNFYRPGQADDGLTVFHQGKVSTITDATAFSRWASEFFDARFPKAPIVRNELINRQNVSSQAATARTKLVAAMIHMSAEEQLAIAKTPPEKAIYLSLLSESGLHRKHRENGWMFARPTSQDQRRLGPVWSAIESLMLSDTPISVSDILQALSEPPYGFRKHPALIVLVAVLIVNDKRLAIREDGTFVTQLSSAHASRLCKAPERFDVRLFDEKEHKQPILGTYKSVFGIDSEAQSIGLVLRAVYEWYLKLPTFVLQTRRLPAPARALLAVLSKANEPIALLSRDIPQCLGIAFKKRATTSQVAQFEKALGEQVRAIDDAQMRLLEATRAIANQVFELPKSTRLSVLRAHIIELFDAAGETPGDAQLSAIRLRTLDTSRDDKRWFESLGALLVELPMPTWTDDSIATFEAALSRAANVLRHVAALRHTGNGRRRNANHLIGVHIVDASGQEQAFTINTKTQVAIGDRTYASLKKTLSSAPDPKRLLIQLLSEFAAPNADNKQRS